MHDMARLIAAEIAPQAEDAINHLHGWLNSGNASTDEALAYLLVAAYRQGERDTREIFGLPSA